MNQERSSTEIKTGMPVFDATGKELGTVEQVTATGLRVRGHDLPRSVVVRTDEAGIHLHLAEAALGSSSTGTAASATQNVDQVVIPLAEERLLVGTREVDLGEVIIRKRIVEEERLVPVTFRREEIEVIRRKPGETWNADHLPEDAEVTRIPIQGWEPVINKEAVVTREAVVDKTTIAETSQVSATVRREQASIDERYRQARPELEQSHAVTTADHGRRSYAEAEPNHRAGFTAGSNPDYTGQQFEEVEPTIRQQVQGTAAPTDAEWEAIRREIRAGFEAARRRD